MNTINTPFAMNDRAFRGHGVFDTILIKNGLAVYLAEHLERLKNHAATMGINACPDEKTVTDFLKAQAAKDATLSILITGGPSERGLKSPENPRPQISMRIFDLPESKPLHAVISYNARRNEGSPLSRIKSLNYGDNILAMQEAEKQGANEAILLNNRDHAVCFTAGNLFILKDHKLYTPLLSEGALSGIIRQKWMDREKISEKSLMISDLENADAIFLTNSLRGIVPITSLNGNALPPYDFKFDHTIHHG